MKIVFVLALAVAAVAGTNIQHGFPSFQYSPFTGRVVGCIEAPQHSAPYIVSLQLLGFHFCSGSIIGNKYVLTAAHCMAYPAMFVNAVAGLHNVRGTPGSQSRRVSKMIKHEQYGGGVGLFDIGVIVLDTGFDFNDKVQSIPLPSAGAIHSVEVTLYGWGRTSTTIIPSIPRNLMTVNEIIIDCKDCEEHLGGTGASLYNICTGPLTGGISACCGDSGGPLIQENVLIGVVSFGCIHCSSIDDVNIETRIGGFIDWIESIVCNNSISFI